MQILHLTLYREEELNRASSGPQGCHVYLRNGDFSLYRFLPGLVEFAADLKALDDIEFRFASWRNSLQRLREFSDVAVHEMQETHFPVNGCLPGSRHKEFALHG